MKKRLSLAIAVFAFFIMAGVSFGANTASINVTSEPIHQAATCDKAGGFTISFDDGTIFNGGDQITFDLDLHVTLCRPVDLEIGLHGAYTGVHALPFSAGYNPLPLGSSASPLTGNGTLAYALGTGGVLFKILGSVGSQRVTINVMSDVNNDGTLESDNTGSMIWSGTNNTDVLALNFLDQSTFTPGAGAAGIFAPVDPNATPKVYAGNYATKAQNTLCINISDPAFIALNQTTIDANFDSKDDKFTFIPSDPQIAHVRQATQYSFMRCMARNPGYILLPGTAIQNNPAIVCVPIENEMETGNGTDGFCHAVAADAHGANKVIIGTAGTAFESTNYQVKLEILVDGLAGEYGAYWSSAPVLTEGYQTQLLTYAITNADGTATAGVTRYQLANGNSATPVASDNDCAIDPSARAVTLTTAASNINLGLTDRYLYINLPPILHDNSFVAGKVLSVRVSLLKAPCGELFTGIWKIGTGGCTSVADYHGLRFPYFAGIGAFTNAIVITNYGSSDGTARFIIYETDGDVFTASVSVKAHGLYVNLLQLMSVTRITGVGAFADARSYVKVIGDFPIDGACMITDPATGESIGYLPRQYLPKYY